MLLKMYLLVLIVHLLRLQHIQHFSKNIKMFCLIFWEMFAIDPSIVEHDIKTYPDAKPVRHYLSPHNLIKVASIKAENEKLLHTNFIYHIRLTE